MDQQPHHPSPPPNPYQPPAPTTGLEAAVVDTPFPASLGRRFGNLVIDSIALGVVVSGLLVVLPQAAAEFGLATQVVAYGLVYVVPEATLGRTVGKLVTGTRVVTREGGKPSIGQVLARTAIRFVPFEALSFLWGDNTGWHDDWSKTLVVPNVDPYEHIQ